MEEKMFDGRISRRAEDLGTETAFAVVKEIERLEQQGREISKFHIGQPDFRTPDNICKSAITAIVEGRHGYTPSAGIFPLRQAIARYLERTREMEISLDSIVVDCGAKPFIHHTIHSVTDYGAGDEVIFQVPGFPIHHSQIISAGAVPRAWVLREKEGKYFYDPNDLEDLITERTRLLTFNDPHNPTGVVSGDKESIAGIILKHPRLWTYSDEPYSNLVFDGKFQSIASFPGMKERTIIADCLSKTYAMPGWRLGFASNEKLAPQLANWVTNINSCAPHFVQYAAIEALNGKQDEAEYMKNEFRKRRDFLVDGLNRIEGIYCPMPEGAFYAWPRVDGLCRMLGVKDSGELQQKLLYEANVAVLADKHFVPEGIDYPGQHLRFAFTIDCQKIEKGLGRLEDYIRKNKR